MWLTFRRFFNPVRRLFGRPTINANGGKDYVFKLKTGRFNFK